MKKFTEVQYEVWSYSKSMDVFGEMKKACRNEVDAISIKRYLSKNETNEDVQYVIIKQIRTTDLLNY